MTAALPISIAMVVECVAASFDVAARDIRSARKAARIAEARHVACWIARELSPATYAVIGRHIGNRDNSTVINSVDRVDARRAADPEFAAKLAATLEACEILGRTQLSAMLRDPDVPSVVGRIVADPLREAARVSTLDVAAMAARVVELEEIAEGAFLLLARLDPAPAASIRPIVDTLASALAALGYVTEPEEPADDHADDHAA